MHVLSALHRFAESGAGDVKALQGREELRLRIGDYRLFFVCPTATLSRFAASVIAVRPTGEVAARTFVKECESMGHRACLNVSQPKLASTERDAILGHLQHSLVGIVDWDLQFWVIRARDRSATIFLLPRVT
jgi:hypothetical protein